MRLSTLHIAGFKSFPDRSELGFDVGVTAIVGPNGCGKSNVVDAITWVLGEQSAKSLRGERMEDVIFNGSDARKPTAAAEVRLRLSEVAQAAMKSATEVDDLLDGAPLLTRDVEIGRRLYRSGESEYLIDGQVCRLRDVHDLLMDSGLGVKAYAVIEQGKIGQILASRPAERRALIEEAAGVTKYKSRRRAAELKLEAAQQNLTRIDDIIFEVEKQRGALKRQAARARRYRRLREELRRWEQVQFAHRYEALAAEIESAEARLGEARTREAGAAARVAELETALETLRLALTEAESAATDTREAGHQRELEIGRRQQQVVFDRQQIEDLGRQASALEAEAVELSARRDPAEQAIAARRAAAETARQELTEAASRVAACEAEYREALQVVQRVEQDSDTTRASVMAAVSTLSALRQARDHAAAVRDRVAVERERLDLEARELEAEAERVRAEEATAAAALRDARAALMAATEARAAAETSLASARATREQTSQALLARQRALAGREARLRSLEELEASRAAFGDAARFLLADTGAGIRHHGAVVDHLEVERSYERAVEALLADLLQYVVVDGAADAAAALARIAQGEVGRCGFLVLDEARNAPATPPLVVPPGSRSLASVVRTVGGTGQIIARILPRALVVESLEAANRLAASVTVPIATMAGEVVNCRWLVEGGSRGAAHGILETRGEILALREDVSRGEEDVTRLSASLAAIEASLPVTEGEVAAAVTGQHDQEKAIVAFEAQVRRASDDLTRLVRRLDVVGTERRQAEEEERAAEARREEATAVIAAQANEQQSAETRLGSVQSELQASRSEAESRLERLTAARADQAGLTERVAAIETDVVRLEESARDLEQRIVTRRAEIGRTDTRREELRQSIRETERLLDEGVGALDDLKTRMRGLDERVTSLRAEFGSREHDLRGARHALEGVRSELMQAEVTRATAAADLTHLASACLEAVGMTIDEVVAAAARMEEAGELAAPARRVADAATPDEDEEEPAAGEEAAVETAADEFADRPLGAEEVIADLRRKIERLGPVNMMAIEQFDELEDRHAFLTTQRKDLLDSIAQTGEAIRKIDKTTRERFEEAFHSINTHFESTFTTLFGGGRAGLVLIDQENDPESGIDIIAQPPGKRLQNVQLLSGGEKALTAMALMFAIFKHRPSPFCLLDEIDAPLDDANIGRFVEMLLGMQAHTQFILITHNRKTMEIADRLYGVTMEEPGVSKLISVDLGEGARA